MWKKNGVTVFLVTFSVFFFVACAAPAGPAAAPGQDAPAAEEAAPASESTEATSLPPTMAPVAAIFLDFNFNIPELQDIRVRQAIAKALDRQTIVGEFETESFVADSPLPPSLAAMFPTEGKTKANWAFDPGNASFLLAEAGHPDGFTVPLYYVTDNARYNADPDELANTIKEQLAQIGIVVQLEPRTAAEFDEQKMAGELTGLILNGNPVDPDDPIMPGCAPCDQPWPGSYASIDSEVAAWHAQAAMGPGNPSWRDAVAGLANKYAEESARIWIAYSPVQR